MSSECDGNLLEISQSDLDGLLAATDGVTFSQDSLSQTLVDWEESVRLSAIGVLNQSQSDLEENRQTGITVGTNAFPGDYKFNVLIEDGCSKNYSYSERFNRLYCSMDKAVPVKFTWEGPNLVHVRALLVFRDPDNVNNPVFRCRSHNDVALANNQGCKHFKHVLRCDSEGSVYKENSQSHRHSVITSFRSKQNSDGVYGHYRFMCSTTCSGPDGIARRKTDIVFTLEDANCNVVGRAVMEVKICSCPLRDKRRAEEEDEGNKRKRRGQNLESESKKTVKRKVNCTVTNDKNDTSTAVVKREADTESDVVNLQVVVPNFPASQVEEFSAVLKRIVASFFATQQDIEAVTQGLEVYKE